MRSRGREESRRLRKQAEETIAIDFDLLIFDMDGVLVDTTPCHRRAYEELWQWLNLSGPPYAQIAGRKTGEVVAELTTAWKPTPSELDHWVRFKQSRAREYLATEEILFSDSAPCLKALVESGCRLALGTGASRKTTELILSRLDHAGSFSIVLTGDDVKQGKPSPEVYLKIIRQAELRPERALIIEDSRSGLDAALASGAWAAAVRTGVQAQSSRFIGSFPDLRALLLTLGVTCA